MFSLSPISFSPIYLYFLHLEKHPVKNKSLMIMIWISTTSVLTAPELVLCFVCIPGILYRNRYIQKAGEYPSSHPSQSFIPYRAYGDGLNEVDELGGLD